MEGENFGCCVLTIGQDVKSRILEGAELSKRDQKGGGGGG